MASRSLNTLDPIVAAKLDLTVRECAEAGIEMLVYCTLRTCKEQARLYARGRTMEHIVKKAASLAYRGFGFLAQAMEDVAPVAGPIVTYAGPGESWHQFGLAADCVPMVDGKCLWDARAHEWQVYGRIAEKNGLQWAGNWTRGREFPHVQFAMQSNPLTGTDPDDIRERIREAGSFPYIFED